MPTSVRPSVLSPIFRPHGVGLVHRGGLFHGGKRNLIISLPASAGSPH